MIPALIALFTLLFFGGNSTDYFLIAELDKGVKKFVIEKETKKEIQSTFKIQSKELKQINKKRDQLIKEFSQLNLDTNSSKESLLNYSNKLHLNLKQQQDIIINTRTFTLALLSDEEWKQMITHSKEVTTKSQAKLQKKLEKKGYKDAFSELELLIKESILNPESETKVLASFQQLESSYQDLANQLNERNILDTPALENKNTSADDLEEMAVFLRELKTKAFNDLVDFRFEILDETNEKEFSKIMKSLNKILKSI